MEDTESKLTSQCNCSACVWDVLLVFWNTQGMFPNSFPRSTLNHENTLPSRATSLNWQAQLSNKENTIIDSKGAPRFSLVVAGKRRRKGAIVKDKVNCENSLRNTKECEQLRVLCFLNTVMKQFKTKERVRWQRKIQSDGWRPYETRALKRRRKDEGELKLNWSWNAPLVNQREQAMIMNRR